MFPSAVGITILLMSQATQHPPEETNDPSAGGKKKEKFRVGVPFKCPACKTKARFLRCVYAVTPFSCRFCGAKLRFERPPNLFWIYRAVDLAIIPLLIWLAVSMSATSAFALLGYAVLGTLYFVWSSSRYGYLRLR